MLIRININKKIIILGFAAVVLLGGGIIIGRMLGKKEVSVEKSASKAIWEESNLSRDIFPKLISEDFSLFKVEEVSLTGCYGEAKKALSAIYDRRSRSIAVTITEYESNKKALEIPKICTDKDARRLEVTPIFRKTGEVLGNPFWLYTTIPFNEEEIRYSYTVFKNYLILVMIPGQLGGTEGWYQEVAEVFVKALKGEDGQPLPSSQSLKQYTFTAQNYVSQDPSRQKIHL